MHMAYRIVYQADTVVWIPEKLRWGRIAGLSMICFVGFWLLTAQLWPDGAMLLHLQPEKMVAIRSGLQQMASYLRAGEPLAEAAYAFCREILKSAKYPG